MNNRGSHTKPVSIWLAATRCLTGAATGQSQNFENEPKARQAQFRIMAQTLGVLSGVARGRGHHDTETARLVAKYRRDIGAFLKTLQPVLSGD